MGKARILLAEDHAIVRSSLRALLEHYPEFEVVGEAEDGQQAIELSRSLQPDLLICDIRMPNISGIEAMRGIKKYSPETKVLALSAYDDEDYVLELFKAGVSGYLLKTVNLEEVIASIRLVCMGQTVFHPAITAKLANVLPRAISGTGKVEDLTLRELEIMRLAAKGLTNRAIGESLALSVRTVEGHIARILIKLDVPSREKAIEYFSGK